MSYTLLQLVDQVSGEMGLTQPTLVIGTSVNQTLQLLALTQKLGKDLLRRFEWNKATKIYVFQTTAALTKTGTATSATTTIISMSDTTTLEAGMVVTGTGMAPYAEIVSVDSSTQVTLNMPATSTSTGTYTFAYQDYAPPSDFNRMVSDTNFDRTNHWRNLGARSSQDWAVLQGGVISVGPRERYRIYNGKLRIFPALTTVYNEAFEYVSNYWVLGASDTAATKASFTLDTDTCIFNDDLMLSGLRYYFRRAKGFDWQADYNDFERCYSTSAAQDVPAAAKSLAPAPYPELVGPWSVPDGSWPTS